MDVRVGGTYTPCHTWDQGQPPLPKKILPRGIVGQALLNLFLKANFLSQPYIPLFLPCIYPAPHQPAVAAKKNLRNKGLFEAFLVADWNCSKFSSEQPSSGWTHSRTEVVVGGPLRLQGTNHFSRLGIVTKLLRNHGILNSCTRYTRVRFYLLMGWMDQANQAWESSPVVGLMAIR